MVPIRVPTPTTTSTRSSIHFIDKKPRLAAGRSNPVGNGEDHSLLWVTGSVSPHSFPQRWLYGGWKEAPSNIFGQWISKSALM